MGGIMIFYGTRGITLTGNSGNFICPNCVGEQPYSRRKVRRFFTLYFIPLIPLDLVGEYIECKSCKNTYNDKVLEIKEPVEAEDSDFEAEYQRAVKKSMAIMVLADGKVEETEVNAMANVFSVITGKEVSYDEMLAEIEATKTEGLEIEAYLKSINGLVNIKGKELIVRALLSIAYADGEFDDQEKRTLIDAVAAMDISESQFQEIMNRHKDDT
jgi:uncharacterized tellurite resistance protein B-like protein